MKKAIYYGLILILAAVFLFSAWNLGTYYLGAADNDRLNDSLVQEMEQAMQEPQPTVYITLPVPSAPTEPTDSTDPTDPTDPDGPDAPTLPTLPVEQHVILPEYAKLYLRNNDLVGWITIEGTNINYPVMQSPGEQNYYLYKNFDGEYSVRGSIYADEECDVFTPSDNVVLYGHHMQDGSMFSALNNFDAKSYWQERRFITFNTLLERHTYEIIAVFKTSASVGEGFRYHQFINAETEEEFNEFVATCKRLAFYDTGVSAEYGDKLLTLSTCEYTLTNGRLVVVAKRVATDNNQ